MKPREIDIKSNIRQKIKSLKFSKETRDSRSAKLCFKIQSSHFFKNSNSIGFYAALPDEIDVFAAAKKALESRKKVFFPKVKRNKIEFFEVKDLEKDLKAGKFGIFEPKTRKITLKRIRPLDLIVVPGRAFDKSGIRLGRGAGYYDRLLAKWPRSVRMGVAYQEQLVTQIPRESHDISMDIVLTA